jgi:peptidoglycan/LPS O-acetylase OafA/YrhL
MKYRDEIDGIRAMAVLAVVIYHADFLVGQGQLLSGGFIGVDVFFVISGYLITRIILGQMAEDQFSLLAFYAGRVRRIVPALVVMVLAATGLAWLYMLPEQLETYAGSALGALGFFSNFVFAFEDSYNADASALKPLLHTWSLGVEGQYYLVFPVLMILIAKTSLVRYIYGIVLIGLAASLLYAQHLSGFTQDQNFFLLPTRAWQLLTGATLAFIEAQLGRREYPPILSVTMPALGLAMIAYAFVFFDDTMTLPSGPSIIPIIGVMLLIWFATPGDLVTYILSTRPVVYIGKISYSLYLWHFPIFAYMRISGFGFDSLTLKLAGIAASSALAIASFYLVEKPFRNPRRIKGPAFWGAVVTTLIAGLSVQGYLLRSDGAPQRLGQVWAFFDEARIEQITDATNTCSDRQLQNACQFGLGDQRVIFLVGDSHAASIAESLRNSSTDNGWALRVHTMAACSVLHGLDRDIIEGTIWNAGKRAACNRLASDLDSLLRDAEPSVIVFFARLPLYLEGTWYDNQEGVVEFGRANSPRVNAEVFPNVSDSGMAVSLALNKWQRYGHELIVVYPWPEMGWNVPRRLWEDIRQTPFSAWPDRYAEIEVSTSYDLFHERTASSYGALDRLPDNGRTFRVRPEDWLCSDDTGRCIGNGPDGIYYRDDDHPSQTGARMIVDRVEAIIRDQITGTQ